ncbi:SixA phosphatase family protein [Portibacter marinus]|uniref:SixA phosphatase family protein n=1 Tax=Portibacter marinus TaxID=2898660 RepID=UPI001F27D53B|nr:histidine phosphatase family protein [Portibacter marinus]
MRILLSILMTLILAGTGSSCKNKKSSQTNSNKIFLVRHAEKGNDGSTDPPLTGEGIRRAESLADLLQYEEISKVYSTDFSRTKETAKPIAHRFNLDIEIYDPKQGDFARKLKNELKKHNIVVVGHSNSTPTLVNDIVGENKFSEIDENNYETLFVIEEVDGNYQAVKKNY